MSISKKKLQKWNEALSETHLESARKEIERIGPVWKWFCFSIDEECLRIISRHGVTPTKLCLKYQTSPSLKIFNTSFGPLHVIIDKNMKGLMEIK